MLMSPNKSAQLFPEEKYTPRIIVWQLTTTTTAPSFSKQEAIFTIDSIAQTGHPIVVLTGHNVLKFPDLYEIIEYGFALGLKIIIEAPPQDITVEILKRCSSFGKKIFRIIVDDCITENPETRFQEKAELKILRECIRRMRQYNFEIHFSITVHFPDVRKLAFYHDYAIRSSADGLYCHLRFQQNDSHGHHHEITTFIQSIAKMKGFSPKNMYFSPQCVKYSYHKQSGGQTGEKNRRSEWNHSCLGGKTFAFINSEGKVLPCEGIPLECGNLRENGFDFTEIWHSSEHFCRLRANKLSCEDAHSCHLPTTITQSTTLIHENENQA
jgi:hypothetical protein